MTEQNHNPQNSMGLPERKIRLSVRKREVETGSPRRALALVGEFAQGVSGPERDCAPEAEALRVGVRLSLLRPRDSASGGLSRNEQESP